MAMQTLETPERTHPGPGAEPCDVCGASTVEIRCKVICNRCGYTRDCSDP